MKRVILLAALVLLSGCRGRAESEDEARSMTALVERAAASEKRTFDRPPRKTPTTPGTFGELFAAQTAEADWLVLQSERSTACARTDAGACEDLASSRSALVALLGATRAERGGTPPRVRAFAPMTPEPSHRPLLATCARTAAEIALEIGRGHAVAAADLCVDGIAVARDYALGASLVGAMVVVACVDKLVPACTRALEAAPTPARVDLGVVVATWPPFTDFADVETSRIALETCGQRVRAEDRAKLGPLADALVAASVTAYEKLPRDERGIAAELCATGAPSLDRLARAMREPPGSATRTKLLEESRAKVKIEPPNLERYEEKWVAARATLLSLNGSATKPP